MSQREKARFPQSVWDGLYHTFTSLDIDSSPDFYGKDRLTAEVIAIEQYLKDTFNFVIPFAPANAVIGVKSDQSGLEYKQIIEGPGILVEHLTNQIKISSSSGITLNKAIVDEDVVKGNLIFLKTNGHIEKANATDKARVAGFVWNDTDAGEICQYITDGQLTLTNWTALIGATNLTTSELYYLSSEPGKMVTSPPITGYVVLLGQAENTITFDIEIQQTIRL